MKSATLIISTALAATGMGMADVPQKAPLTKYQNLWTDSPFTAKPPEQIVTTQFNPLQNYVLLGVSPIPEGFRVTIQNKKSPSEPAIVVKSHKPNEGFSIIDVQHQKGNPLATVVEMRAGSQVGKVSFDEKFLVVKAPAPPAQQPPGANAAAPTKPTATTQRPRVLPPTSNSKDNNSNREERRRR